MTQVPQTMPAAVFMGLRDVAVEDRPTPRPKPGELLLEVSHCGICGSDLHFLIEWGGKSGVIEGHEFSGTVAALGEGVTGWAVGDRAIGGPSPKCGTCEFCLTKRTSLCIERNSVAGND
jgi:L-iditol 2-dehydrogenase